MIIKETTTLQYILIFIVIVFVTCFAFFAVIIGKDISYNYFYKEKVVTTIKDNVKGSCLR